MEHIAGIESYLNERPELVASRPLQRKNIHQIADLAKPILNA